jgi:hypothetical protein
MQSGKSPESLFEAYFYPIFAGLLAFFSSIGVVYGVIIGVVVGGSLIFAFITVIVLVIVRTLKARRSASDSADVELANTPRGDQGTLNYSCLRYADTICRYIIANHCKSG